MRRVLNVLILTVILAALAVPALAVSGTYDECIDGCLPGVNDCDSCCDQVVEGCLRSVQQKYQQCKDACPWTDRACTSDCESQYTRDHNHCTSEKKYSFQCPDWQAAQECPYDCQKWNPASRSCVGAKMNGCR